MGDLHVVTDWSGVARCVIRITHTGIVAFENIDVDHVLAEGEGDGALEWWRREHWAYYQRELAAIGEVPTPEMPIVFERFKVVYPPVPAVEWHLRAAAESDRTFLYTLHRTTMRGVIEKTWGWDDAWQQTDFDRRYADYIVSIIEIDGRAAGSLWIEWKPDSLYVHELQVMPGFQSKGLGTAVMQDLIEQAAARGLPVTLAVVPANIRAQHIYERLGFVVTAVEHPFIRMSHTARLASSGSDNSR